jgi:phage tail tape-measure protein
MSFGEFARFLDETEEKAREKALIEGKSLEDAKTIAEQERMASGSAVITALARSTAWSITGAAVGSVVPVVGTAVGATIGFVGGAISAIVDPKPSLGKAAKDYFSVLRKILK